jgi:hypothetical protein
MYWALVKFFFVQKVIWEGFGEIKANVKENWTLPKSDTIVP